MADTTTGFESRFNDWMTHQVPTLGPFPHHTGAMPPVVNTFLTLANTPAEMRRALEELITRSAELLKALRLGPCNCGKSDCQRLFGLVLPAKFPAEFRLAFQVVTATANGDDPNDYLAVEQTSQFALRFAVALIGICGHLSATTTGAAS